MSAETTLRHAARLMAERLKLFKRTAEQARETDSRVDLAAAELWEPADEQALNAYDDALLQINGARPLPMELPA